MRIIPALVLTLAVLPLAAETTGRISGKVTTKDGKPVSTAKASLKRIDINWSKELKISSDGRFMQVGLDPKEFELHVSAEGFAPYMEKVKIPLGDVLEKTVILLTPQQAKAAGVAMGVAVPIEDPGAGLENTGADAYNQAVELYNEKKYTEALPLVELAYQSLKESAEKTKDEAAKATVKEKLATVERTYAVTLFEVGSSSESKKANLDKAKPLLEKVLAANPKDNRAIDALLKTAKVQKDKEGEKKYQAMVDAILGPRPEVHYNEAVNAFNNGQLKEAKEGVLKAIQIDPKFADSYWLLGVVEFSLGNNGGAKSNLRKYLEIAPTGKKADEVKLMLKELK